MKKKQIKTLQQIGKVLEEVMPKLCYWCGKDESQGEHGLDKCVGSY